MSAPEVTVIDYGVGNLLSVQRGLEQCGAKVLLTADPEKVLTASRVVLPGVGAYGSGMQALERLGLVAVIRELAKRDTPLLGICLGMQLLFEESEEFGTTTGLGLIPGRVIPVPTKSLSGDIQKIPHIGWCALQLSNAAGWQHTLLQDIRPGEAAYFVHSYRAAPSDPTHCLADCYFGGHKIVAVVRQNLIIGCQFHPEKSGEVGLKILRRFCVN